MAAPEVEWERLKAHELRALAAEGAVAILPIASIEQHGPHLPVMTDTRLGREVAVRAARKACATRPVVVAPVVWCGLSEHHMPFGGTLLVSHATFRAIIRDLVGAMARHGFRDILISNSHGGNINAMRQIIDELSLETEATLIAVGYGSEAAEAFGDVLEDQPRMHHACEAETSMMMALEPDLVDASSLDTIGVARDASAASAGRTGYRWRNFTQMTSNGVSGEPRRASAAKGERLLEIAADAIAALIVDPASWGERPDLRAAETGGVPFR